MDKSNLFLFLVLISLTLVINNYAYAIDYDLECPENKIVVVRTTNPNPVCVFDTTAERWVGLGIAEFIDTTPEENTIETIPEEETIDAIPEEMVETLQLDHGEEKRKRKHSSITKS